MTNSWKVLFIIAIILSVFLCRSLAIENVKFVVFSDPHLSLPAEGVIDDFKLGLHSLELLENTIKDINEIPNLKFVLIPGDITKDGEPWNVDKFVEILSKLKVPFYVILGNHDQSIITQPGKVCQAGLSKSTIIWALQGHGFNGPHGCWSTDPVPNLHLVGLDTNIIGYWGGRISEAQLKWLDSDLSINRNKLTIVMGHHSIVPFSKDEEKDEWASFYLENGDKLLQLFVKYPEVAFYFSGHRHISTRYIEHNGVYHIVHPSIVTYPMRYTVYELSKHYLDYEVRDVPVSSELWEMGKENFLQFGDFWRLKDTPNTPEGNKKYLEYYESNDTKKARLPLRFE